MTYLSRVIVVHPTATTPTSYVDQIFAAAAQPVPAALADWEPRVNAWCQEYRAGSPEAKLIETPIDTAVYLFDLVAERVVLAYAVSTRQLQKRDAGRMRGFPDVNVGVRAVLGEHAFLADRGHFLGHASGGVLDINLFPQRRELNRGWSAEGRRFRQMERYIADHPGTFFFHRPIYDDPTWIPARLEYGLLVDHDEWWTDEFRNK
jgi:hypothetical protein